MKKQEKVEEKDLEKYQKEYSESKFWDKLKKIAKKIGLKATAYALVLYYVLQKPEVPTKDKALIIGCLGYFILPADLLPDFIPALGYTDDVLGMLFAMKRSLQYVDKELKRKVREKLASWFQVEEGYLEELLEKM